MDIGDVVEKGHNTTISDAARRNTDMFENSGMLALASRLG